MRKFNITTISGENTSNTKSPILLLLSHSHYTPLKDDSNKDTWYELCAQGKLAPWRDRDTDPPTQNLQDKKYNQEKILATGNSEYMVEQPLQEGHYTMKDIEDCDTQKNKKEGNDGWTKVKRIGNSNTKLGLSKTTCERSKIQSRKYWNITNEDDTTSTNYKRIL